VCAANVLRHFVFLVVGLMRFVGEWNTDGFLSLVGSMDRCYGAHFGGLV
jgi:hypothetical protein